MVSSSPLEGNQALSYDTFHLLPWPALFLATAVLIIVFLIFLSIATPKREARHVHEPRHAKAGSAASGQRRTRGI